jgi:adhesin transport system outer membrane protein
MTIADAARRAIAWHPSVTQAVAKMNQQAAGIGEAEDAYWPKLNWGVDSTYVGGAALSNPALNLTGSQTLYDFGKTDSSVQLASAGTDRSRAEIVLAVDKLAYETTLAIIEVQRHRDLLSVAAARARDIDAIVELVRQRTAQGAGTQSDMLQAETRAQAARTAALQIETEYKRWESIALSLTGTQAPLRLQGGMPAWLNGACAASARIEKSPAYLEAMAGHAVAVAQLDQIRAQAMPTLELQGQVGADLMRLGQTDPSYKIGLNVSGSLYSGGTSAARVEGAEHAVEAAKAALALAQVETQRSLAETSSQLSTMKRLKTALTESQSTLDQTRALYRTQYTELGTRTLLDLLNAEDDYHSARHDAVSVGYDFNTLALDCVRNSGELRDVLGLTQASIRGLSI